MDDAASVAILVVLTMSITSIINTWLTLMYIKESRKCPWTEIRREDSNGNIWTP